MTDTAVFTGRDAQARFGPVPVERLWPHATVVCLGSGPSLTRGDVDAVRGGRAKVIAVKNTIDLAPWADLLYGCGADAGGDTWWRREGPRLGWYRGLRYTLDPRAAAWASVLRLDTASEGGLSLDGYSLRRGGHSGYQVINLAVLLGVTRIVLLGYDCQRTGGRDHYFGAHPHGNPIPYDLFLLHFPSIVAPLQQLGVTVVNASRETAITCFPRVALEEALA